MSSNFKRTETVVIDAEVEGIEAGIDSVLIQINHEDGAPIVEEMAMEEGANQQFRYFWETIDFAPDTWAASTAYSLKDQVQPPTPNTYRYYCITAGDSYSAEPEEWVPEEDDDGNLIFNESPPIWEAGKTYALDDEIVPTTSDGNKYVCSVAGESGSSEPTWDSDLGDTTADGVGALEWTATAWNYCSWQLWPIQVIPGIYVVDLAATDADSHRGLKDFKIRITE